MEEKRPFRVMLVDDDKDILELLEYNLRTEGFKVKTVQNSGEAIASANEFRPDLIILDVFMPHPNGIEICRELRNSELFTDTYIFFLTATSEGYFEQVAYETGGDDFIEKLAGLRALTTRITSVLKRRLVIRKRQSEINLGGLHLNRKTLSVTLNGISIVLNPPEFEVLYFFAQNPGKVITAQTLLQNLYGSEVYLYESSVERYMQNIIRRTGDRLIKWVGGDKYVFNPRMAS